jgi:hypothetical protein
MGHRNGSILIVALCVLNVIIFAFALVVVFEDVVSVFEVVVWELVVVVLLRI